jgi:hypothetical protein
MGMAILKHKLVVRIDAAENPSMISDGYGHIEAQVGI